MSDANALIRPTQNPATRFGSPGQPTFSGPRLPANTLQLPPPGINALAAPTAPEAPPAPVIQEVPRMASGTEHRVSTGDAGAPHDAEGERFVRHAHDNIAWLWDRSRGMLGRDAALNQHWTANQAAKDLADEHGVSHRQAAGLIAASSTRAPLETGIERARRLLEIRRDHAETPFTPEMRARVQADIDGRRLPESRALWQKKLDAIHEGAKLGGLTHTLHQAMFVHGLEGAQGHINETAAALRALEGDETSHIHRALGDRPRLRHLYNAIIAPDHGGDVPLDGDAVNAARMMPASARGLGAGGSHRLYADAYRRAAETISQREGRRYLPREVASVASAAARGLFDDPAHGAMRNGEPAHPLGQAARNGWFAARYGFMHPDAVRERIHRLAGGITVPIGGAGG